MRPVDADEILKKQKDLIRRTCDEVYANDWHDPVILAMSSVAGIVLDAPTIEIVKHGKWIEVANYHTWGGTRIKEFKCSLCNEIVNWHKYKFCPYCGAKMDGDEE